MDAVMCALRVERGLLRLDAWKQDWFLDIDMFLLNFNESPRCVIGQLTGSYIERRHEVGIMNYRQAYDEGFTADSKASPEEKAVENEFLKKLWIKGIMYRLQRHSRS
jgi:hypothetical protein